MIEIVREARVEAPAGKVWEIVSSTGRAAEWFAFAERVEVIAGEGTGQLRRQHGHWGRKHAVVDQEVTEYTPERVLAWRHLAERLDGKPAPQFARSTEFRIELEPDDGGAATHVRLRSRQEPAGPVKALVMKLFGTRDVARSMERSLERLSATMSG